MDKKKFITIIYSKVKYKVLPKSEIITESLDEFSNLINKKKSELFFVYKGKPLNNSKSINKYSENNIKIFAFNLKKNLEKENLNQIICPECNNSALININSDRISITDCCKKHNVLNIPFDEFMESQEIKESEILCDLCTNKQNLYGEKFKICSCGKKLCNICSLSHEGKHERIEYKNRYNRCLIHGIKFETYCFNCNVNLCPSCEQGHSKHKITFRKKILPTEEQINSIRKGAIEIKKIINEYKNELHKVECIISNIINSIESDINDYLKINENILILMDNLENYETIKNINTLNETNRNLKKEISHFIKSNFKGRLKILTDLYDKKPKNEMTMIYKNTFFNQNNEEGETLDSNEDLISNSERESLNKSGRSTISRKSLDEMEQNKRAWKNHWCSCAGAYPHLDSCRVWHF